MKVQSKKTELGSACGQRKSLSVMSVLLSDCKRLTVGLFHPSAVVICRCQEVPTVPSAPRRKPLGKTTSQQSQREPMA